MAEMEGSTDILAALAAFKENYAKKIPAKTGEIRQSWETLKADRENGEVFQQLHRQSHTLAGTAGTYGFEEIGNIAKAIETTVDDLTENHSKWTAADMDKVESLLLHLEALAGDPF